VTRSAMGAFNLIDIANMAKRLLPAAWKTAVWLVNCDALGELIQLNQAASNPAGIINFGQNTILGRPFIPTELLPAFGNAGDIALVDFSHYVIGDRSMVVSMSPDVPTYFEKGQSYWRMVVRYDGQPIIKSSITPKSGVNALSAFVALTTAS
jgi:HK97 family phage major capsid protein